MPRRLRTPRARRGEDAAQAEYLSTRRLPVPRNVLSVRAAELDPDPATRAMAMENLIAHWEPFLDRLAAKGGPGWPARRRDIDRWRITLAQMEEDECPGD